MMKVNIHEDYLRSLLFGLQDGLVSTTGVVVGITIGVQDKPIIILASLVAVTVEASSMAAGQYSSEKAVHQMAGKGKHTDNLIVGATVMFLAYLVAGLIPIAPIVLLEISLAPVVSMFSSFAALYILGYLKGRMVKHSPMTSGLEMLLIGGVATTLGIVVGYLLRTMVY